MVDEYLSTVLGDEGFGSKGSIHLYYWHIEAYFEDETRGYGEANKYSKTYMNNTCKKRTWQSAFTDQFSSSNFSFSRLQLLL